MPPLNADERTTLESWLGSDTGRFAEQDVSLRWIIEGTTGV